MSQPLEKSLVGTKEKKQAQEGTVDWSLVLMHALQEGVQQGFDTEGRASVPQSFNTLIADKDKATLETIKIDLYALQKKTDSWTLHPEHRPFDDPHGYTVSVIHVMFDALNARVRKLETEGKEDPLRGMATETLD